MDLLSVKTIKELFSKYNARPLKIMGQNFLINQKILAKIMETAELSEKDIVLEVGPGIGTLTQSLAQKAKRVIAIEKDKIMVEIIQETFKNYRNIEIIQDNALKFEPKSRKLKNKRYKIVANIPYYLTSPLIRKFLEEKSQPSEMVLMVQKEVAQRICSKPPKMSLLAVSVQFYAEPEIISYVSRESFWPKPKVDSAIIKIIPKSKNLNPKQERMTETQNSKINTEIFFKIVKAGFSQPRKQLRNNLLKMLMEDKREIYPVKSAASDAAVFRKAEQFNRVNLWLLKSGVNPEQRAETLTTNDWVNLLKSFPL